MIGKLGSCVKTAAPAFRAAPVVMACCIFVVVSAAFVSCAEQTTYLLANGLRPGYLDSLVWLFSSHRGIPLLWCVAPAALMVWLTVASSNRQGVSWAVRHGSARELWVEDVADAVVGALVFAVATVLSACAAAAVFSGDSAADFGPHGVFAAVTGQVPVEPLDTAAVIAEATALSILVLAVFGTAFQFGRLLLGGPAVPFAVLVLLGLPAVHGPQAFFIEVARLLSLDVDPNGVTNPLSLPFYVSSVFYGSWLPGAGHGLWLQAALFAALFVMGVLVASRKDLLRS
ncbi:hypothetical protein [Adlercreutzia sp. ZJ242]|uniref:hypothetical protein n=1 Tax=Adlercreutzia sp. ZJ242 TaxID=2709409 RepID=UPI0013ED0874|nr:hypothetical protein [Adlercreutzia sp. ZJ242]